MIIWKSESWVNIMRNRWTSWMIPVDVFLARWCRRKVFFWIRTFRTDSLKTKIPEILVGLNFGSDDNARGKGNSGKIQDTVTLVSREYAHWTLVAQVRPAPDYGGSTLWEIHRCYHILKLSGYLIWIISSTKLGSWSSWPKTLFHKIGSNIDGNFAWSRPWLINFMTSFCLVFWLFACLHFNPCLSFGATISL